MKNFAFGLMLLSLSILPQLRAFSSEEIVGVQPLVVSISEVDLAPKGWSAKKSILNQDVFNEKNEKVGQIEDLVINRDSSISFAILSVNRFLGVSTHKIAIPIKLFSLNEGGKLTLEGANLQALKELPNFQYK